MWTQESHLCCRAGCDPPGFGIAKETPDVRPAVHGRQGPLAMWGAGCRGCLVPRTHSGWGWEEPHATNVREQRRMSSTPPPPPRATLSALWDLGSQRDTLSVMESDRVCVAVDRSRQPIPFSRRVSPAGLGGSCPGSWPRSVSRAAGLVMSPVQSLPRQCRGRPAGQLCRRWSLRERPLLRDGTQEDPG